MEEKHVLIALEQIVKDIKDIKKDLKSDNKDAVLSLDQEVVNIIGSIQKQQHSAIGESLKVQVDLSNLSNQINSLKEIKVSKEISFPDARRMLSNFAQGINQRKIVLGLLAVIFLLSSGLVYLFGEYSSIKPKADNYIFSKFYFRDSTNYYFQLESAFKNDSIREVYMDEAWKYDKLLKAKEQARMEAQQRTAEAEAAKERERELEQQIN